MSPDVVVDVGNTRIKWGHCVGGQVAATAAFPPDDHRGWEKQLAAWHLPRPANWVVTGVEPRNRQVLVDWLTSKGERVQHWQDGLCLPIRIAVDNPARVGMDRLLNAVAALSRRKPGQPVAIVDAGSAVTVDWLDQDGAFCGGAIFPGFRLMALALHSYTAQLPVVEVCNPEPALPGRNTHAAIEAGIFWSVAGGVQSMLERLGQDSGNAPLIFVTGGDGPAIAPCIGRPNQIWPAMTLEGIRLAAEQTP